MTTRAASASRKPPASPINIVPKQGGNNLSGMVFVLGFSKGMQSRQLHDELQRAAPCSRTRLPRLRLQRRRRRPIVKDKLWYYMSVRPAGAAAGHAETCTTT
jgi:hypothetical protein